VTPTSYDSRTIRFHWASAALIVAIWGLGQTADYFPKELRSVVWSTHITLGGVLAALWIGGLLWRSSGGRQLPAAGPGVAVRLTTLGNGLLYLGIGAVIAFGVLTASARGSVLWGFFAYPKVIGDDMIEPLTRAHGWAANLLLLVAAAHGLTVLVRHFGLRDGVLARMWPGLARG
jgi:cytochrome b561